MRYRCVRVDGGTYFFTVHLAAATKEILRDMWITSISIR